MRALNVPAAGQPPRLSDVPRPDATEGTVLISVRAAGLNAIDNRLASGQMAARIPHEYPLVLGRDGAGIVEAVGAGVTDIAIGDEVLGHVLLAPPVQAGTIAEHAVLPAAAVTRKPAGLDFVTAAALPLAGTAAMASVDTVDPQPGQTVLVVGATGGVGNYAVQLLAARGVTVVATGTPTDDERLRDLGAAQVVDYTTGPAAEQVLAAHPHGIDAVVDFVAATADELPLGAVRKGGRIASTLGAADNQTLAAAGVTGTNVSATPVRAVLARLADLAANDALRVDVTTVLPLEQAAEGLATLAAGKARGKIVITIDAPAED